MGHPQIDNQTPFAVECLFVGDEEGRPILVPVVKATYRIGRAAWAPAPEQVPVNLSGTRSDPPEGSSYTYEPETAFCKVATDVVLVADAYAPRGGAREVDVTLKVGRLEKTVHVTGDRTWTKRLGGRIAATDPTPF